MLSQNNKLLVLGDSNVGMLKDLWDIDRNILGYENVSFWYHTGSAFNTIKVKDGLVVCNARGALPAVRLADFDHVLWAGGRLRTSQVFEPIMSAKSGTYSHEFISTLVIEYLNGLPATRSLRALRQNFEGRISILTTPLRSANAILAGALPAAEGTQGLYSHIWTVYQEIAVSLGAKVFTLPETMVEQGYLVPVRYDLTSDDDLHKNADYARDILAASDLNGIGSAVL